jgi:glucokinase
MDAIVVDLGATAIRVGCEGLAYEAPIFVERTPSSPAAIVDALCTVIRNAIVATGLSPDCVVVGCPGLVDGLGRIHKALYLPLGGLDLRRHLEDRLGFRVLVVNDVSAQACGCATEDETLFYMGIGTGIGGAQIEGGRLIQGHRGFAGEIGHISLPRLGKRCLCGNTGCLDTAASGQALEALLGVEWWDLPITSEANEALSQAGDAVGVAATAVGTLLDPQRVVVAGRLVSHDAFRTAASARWMQHEWSGVSLEFFDDTWPFAAAGLLKMGSRSTQEEVG